MICKNLKPTIKSMVALTTLATMSMSTTFAAHWGATMHLGGGGHHGGHNAPPVFYQPTHQPYYGPSHNSNYDFSDPDGSRAAAKRQMERRFVVK